MQNQNTLAFSGQANNPINNSNDSKNMSNFIHRNEQNRINYGSTQQIQFHKNQNYVGNNIENSNEQYQMNMNKI